MHSKETLVHAFETNLIHFGGLSPSIWERLESIKCNTFVHQNFKSYMTVELHPLEPFLPANAQMLFLGSFPPPRARWSMDFFYPNWINDFWRIQGMIHFDDKSHFECEGEKSFDIERIVDFCQKKGIALYDTARKVCRLKDNADDNFLEIIEGTDVFELLEQMPKCRTVVTTGGKASEELQAYFEKMGIKVKIPKVGEWVAINVIEDDISAPLSDFGQVRHKEAVALRWWRMPSSSRAYPMKLEKKAEYYRRLFEEQLTRWGFIWTMY